MTLVPFSLPTPEGHLAAARADHGGRPLLLFPPLAEERKGAVRPLSDLARRAATAGHAPLLFDYRGTGDSPGEFAATTPRSLQADCDAAFAAATADADAVTLLGVRMGAWLALDLASRHPGRVKRLCLWAPVLSPSHWLRELRRRSRFRRGADLPGLAAYDVDGYEYSEELVRWLDERTDASPPACPLDAIAIGARAEPPGKLVDWCAPLQARIRSVVMPPFWLETDVVDPDALIQTTLDLLSASE